MTEPRHVAVDGEDAGHDRLVQAGDRRATHATACSRVMPGGSMATTSTASLGAEAGDRVHGVGDGRRHRPRVQWPSSVT